MSGTFWARFGGAIVAVTLLVSSHAAANGIDFFADAVTPGPDPLLYYGRILDENGKPLSRARVYVSIDKLAILIETHANNDGTYQTHDLVKALEMIGESVDPAELNVYVIRKGYKQRLPKNRTVPPVKRGKIKVDFVMTEN